MSFNLLIVSAIPVYHIGEEMLTLDLWARDLEGQVSVCNELVVVCPVIQEELTAIGNLSRLPLGVNIEPISNLKKSIDYENVIAGFDVVQLSANNPIRQKKIEIRFLKLAKKRQILCIVGISSNRSKTILINSTNRGTARRIKSWILHYSIKLTYKYFTRFCNGTFITGEGLKGLIDSKQSNVHVGTASWIKQCEIIPNVELEKKISEANSAQALKLCVATRLEKMKGVHIAIDALQNLKGRMASEALMNPLPTLLVLGSGEELDNLKQQVKSHNLSEHVTFGGTRSYPGEFFREIRTCFFMLLTNLNDEQPRLVFDAIANGVVPICPDSPPFRALKLDKRIYFTKGDACALSSKILEFTTNNSFDPVMRELFKTVEERTISSMHEKRAKWISQLVLKNASGQP